MFNISFGDRVSLGEKNGREYFTSPILEEVWQNGHVQVGELNFESASYAARYCLKKITGVLADEHYMKVDADGVARWVQPEYISMSRGRPCGIHRSLSLDCGVCEGGIGWRWYKKYGQDIFPWDEVPVAGKGVLRKAPRYYMDLLAKHDETLVEKVKEMRQRFRREHAEEFTSQRLESKHKIKKARTELLERTLE